MCLSVYARTPVYCYWGHERVLAIVLVKHYTPCYHRELRPNLWQMFACIYVMSCTAKVLRSKLSCNFVLPWKFLSMNIAWYCGRLCCVNIMSGSKPVLPCNCHGYLVNIFSDCLSC